jgi:hypothetical protein
VFTDEAELKKTRALSRKWVHHMTHKRFYNKKLIKVLENNTKIFVRSI